MRLSQHFAPILIAVVLTVVADLGCGGITRAGGSPGAGQLGVPDAAYDPDGAQLVVNGSLGQAGDGIDASATDSGYEAGAWGALDASSSFAVSPDSANGARPAPVHRPKAVACSASPGGTAPAKLDGGQVSCSNDADCSDAGARFSWCTASICYVDGLDNCLSDTDCPAGQACACTTRYGGFNYCTPSNCRTDSDCGPGGLCSPSYNAGCSSALGGYFCRTAADTCETDSDCKGDGGPLPSFYSQQCGYEPSVGHWVCRTASACPPG